MPTIYEIPLVAGPQSLSITLANVQYRLSVRWIETANGEGGWLLDIADKNGNAILSGRPFVVGADMLGQFDYLGLGFGLYTMTDGDPDMPPTFANLGTSSHLYCVVP